ncbi:MAG: cbb3-type cytochrome c oxidase subunit 3 [Myxococcales bacterium]|nr:cbb3-type cytochrome c oxidase subunit 3 [Myxococcales bacterium]MCB9580636.1 cbb3-type cytochrome c oxidase subunit 3 [Polyangiaceae bacterium]
MRLSDIMSNMALSGWAEAALVIFFAVFLLVAYQVLHKKNREAFEQARFMPLDDETPQSPREGKS